MAVKLIQEFVFCVSGTDWEEGVGGKGERAKPEQERRGKRGGREGGKHPDPAVPGDKSL